MVSWIASFEICVLTSCVAYAVDSCSGRVMNLLRTASFFGTGRGRERERFGDGRIPIRDSIFSWEVSTYENSRTVPKLSYRLIDLIENFPKVCNIRNNAVRACTYGGHLR